VVEAGPSVAESNMDRLVSVLLFSIAVMVSQASAQPDVAEISEGTVRVVSRSATKIGTGSGFVASHAGHIITNQHVVRGGTNFSIIQNDTKLEITARLVAQSRALDLAILKIEPGQLTPLTLTTSLPGPGSDVWAFGFPGNADRLAEQVRPTITRGVLSNVFDGSWHEDNQLSIIQHSAGISPGSSGGPLVDNCGRVVGVNSKGSGSRVLHDANGNVVDVFAGTQIYFSSNIDEAISFLSRNGVPTVSVTSVCANGQVDTEFTVAEIDELRREVDKIQSVAAESGQVSLKEIQRLEDQLDAATLLNIEQSKKISTVLQLSLLAAAMGILVISLLAFRRPRTQVVRGSQSSLRVQRQFRYSRELPRRRLLRSGMEFVVWYSNGYVEDERRVVLSAENEDGFVIGRDPELCDLSIDDPRLSPRQLRFTFGGDGSLVMEDLNSGAQTVLEGRVLQPFRPERLRMGANISSGAMRLHIRPVRA